MQEIEPLRAEVAALRQELSALKSKVSAQELLLDSDSGATALFQSGK